jgi:hypothetical protein
MRIILLTGFLIFWSLSYGQHPVNNLNKLNETIQDFTQAFVNSGHISPTLDSIPKIYYMSQDEYVAWKQRRDPGIVLEFLQKEYKEKHLPRIARNYRSARRAVGEKPKVLSFDTVTFNIAYDPVIDVSFRFKSLSKNKKEDEKLVITFLLWNDQLKFIGEYRQTTDYDYDRGLAERFMFAGENIFNTRFRNIAFITSLHQLVPFQQNRKWGLQSFENKIVVQAVYDSIFPFANKYAKVATKGGYNLLDRNFKPAFSQPAKKIDLFDEQYLVTGFNGVTKTFPEGKIIEYETVMSGASLRSQQSKTPEQILADSLLQRYERDNKKFRLGSVEKKGDRIYFAIDSRTNDTLSLHHGFSRLDGYGLFLSGYRNDSTLIMDMKGKILLRTKNICRFESPGYFYIFNKQTRLLGAYCPYSGTYVEPKYLYIKAVDRDRFFIVVTQKNQLGYLNSKGKELF